MKSGFLVVMGVLMITALQGLSHGPSETGLEGAAQGILESEFVFADSSRFRNVHASTLAETADGIVVAWRGAERDDPVGIWVARKVGDEWAAPIEVARCTTLDDPMRPCLLPVLSAWPDNSIRLFYKVGRGILRWHGAFRSSVDDGMSWSDERLLPEGIMGPVKNKPLLLEDGSIVSPSSRAYENSEANSGVYFERTLDGGRSWAVVRPAPTVEGDVLAIQAGLLQHPGGRLQAIGRTADAGRIFTAESQDQGETWGPVGLTVLPNPNSGMAAITLSDGRHLLVYNHSTTQRSPLNVAISRDGILWEASVVLENEEQEYSYPSVLQTSDGLVHITYTWRRKHIKHVVIDPDELTSVAMPEGEWPTDVR